MDSHIKWVLPGPLQLSNLGIWKQRKLSNHHVGMAANSSWSPFCLGPEATIYTKDGLGEQSPGLPLLWASSWGALSR